MLDFSQVKQIIAPFGEIIKIQNVIGDVLWSKLIRRLFEWRGLSPLTCTPTVAGEFEEVKVYGQSKQGVLPDGYEEYSSVTDTNGIVYTAQNGIYPAKRLLDNTFGLYDTNTQNFRTEV